MKVLSFGEILWDVIDGEEHLGGAPFNFAVHAAKCGNDSFIISRLGSDYLGMRAYNKSKIHGVDLSLIQWDENYPTGVVDVMLVDGQPDYTIRQNAAYDFIEGGVAFEALRKLSFDVFYFGSLSQRNLSSRHALMNILSTNSFAHIFYDVNLRKTGYSESIVKGSLLVCNIFKLNIDEVPIIAKMITGIELNGEEFCKCLKEVFPNISLIILTAAEKGCFIFRYDKYIFCPGTPVKAKDAVGAGDAFSAAFMHIYVSGGDALKAAQIANEVAAFMTTKSGAIHEYSSRIKDLLFRNSTKFSDTPHQVG